MEKRTYVTAEVRMERELAQEGKGERMQMEQEKPTL
jgi:hypothetical protein